MKETTCAFCGRTISIANETAYKQHVLCPHCGGKFSYLVDSAEFSAERLAYAVATCKKNSVDSRYYHQAPAGARLYIGLLFYGKVFKEDMDANLYLAAMRKVEPQLKKRDWQYLLDNESDPELASYYKDRFDMAHIGPSSAVTLHTSDYFKPDTSTVKAVAVPRETIPAICPLCGEKITISVDVQDGQHVWCPYCDKKFDYHSDCHDKGGEGSTDIKGEAQCGCSHARNSRVGFGKQVKTGWRSAAKRLVAHIKTRHEINRKKRERKRNIIAKIAVLCIFIVSLAGSIAAYSWYQHWAEEQQRAREVAARSLAKYMSDTSCILSDYYSKYSISFQNWRSRQIEGSADAEKVRVWQEKVAIVQSSIRRLLYDFNECSKGINSQSKSIQDLNFEQTDFEFRVENLLKCVRQIGFDPPNANNLNKEPKAPNPSKADTPEKPTVAPPTRPPGPIQLKPMTNEERMHAKVNELVEKLKRNDYVFDPDALKKEDLQTQLRILQEMWDDVLMSQKKELRPSR